MRIIFMGTPEFAVPSLKLIVEAGHEVIAVVTAPDKPAGRGKLISQSAVKKFALERGLLVLQPSNLKAIEFIHQLQLLKAELQIVVAFRMLPEVVWNMPKFGTYNLHASLLPKYRGAAPINWAIINGDQETGITTFKLKQEIDTGQIVYQKKIGINEETNCGELHDELMNEGAELILKTIETIEAHAKNGTEMPFQKQEDAMATHAPKIFKADCKINWNRSTLEVKNLIRGLSPYPGAYTLLHQSNTKSLLIKIFKVKILETDSTLTNGSLMTDGKTFLNVFANNGLVSILELQLEGKKRMRIEELLKGFTFESGAHFD